MIHIDIVSIGHSHKQRGESCDDNLYFLSDKSQNFLVFAVCDGAGYAKFGNEGARIASKVFCESIYNNKDVYNDLKNLIKIGLLNARKALENYAKQKGCSVKDLGTTLSGGIYKNGKLICTLIGDSPSFVIDNNYNLFCPVELAKGEYINETVFLISDV